MNKKEKHKEICKELGLDPKKIPMILDVKDALKLLKSKVKIPTFKDVEAYLRDHFLADWSLMKMAEAMNLQPDGKIWQPNYHKKPLEDKWEARWWEVQADEKNPSGFGFSYSHCDGWDTNTGCGSRLAFQDVDRLRYVMLAHKGLFVRKLLILKQKK